MSLFRGLIAVHLIFVISWMAGILYLLRLFVYHAQEAHEVVRERFSTMEFRLYRYITLPAMAGSVLVGFIMIGMSPGLLSERWLQIKILLATCMVWVTLRAGRYVGEFKDSKVTRGHRYFRVLNEIPTLLMILIVLLVILRPSLTS